MSNPIESINNNNKVSNHLFETENAQKKEVKTSRAEIKKRSGACEKRSARLAWANFAAAGATIASVLYAMTKDPQSAQLIFSMTDRVIKTSTDAVSTYTQAKNGSDQTMIQLENDSLQAKRSEEHQTKRTEQEEDDLKRERKKVEHQAFMSSIV